MHVGFTSVMTDEGIDPRELASALEQRSFESLWVGEHSHIPTSRRTPYVGGGELPRSYARMMDPLLVLMAAASATTTLRLGSGVLLPLERDLISGANEIATLDFLSGGRLLLGVGPGWNAEELANHSPIAWSHRHRALREKIDAMRSIWTDDEAQHDGEYFSFEPLWCYPKPRQHPHPPVILGASGPVGLRHAVAWADGWMPMVASPEQACKKAAHLEVECERQGRERSSISMSLMCLCAPTVSALEQFAALGVERVVFGGEFSDPFSSAMMSYLDDIADVIEKA
jgi:probable F420-dependent oxidoreductase